MDPAGLSMLLLSTLSPDQQEIRRAEEQLKVAKRTPGFALNLLTLCRNATDANSLAVSKAAAIYFKNFVKLNWDVQASQEAGQTPDAVISPEEKHSIKEGMVDLMCSVHPAVQKQLSEGVRIIAAQDWPERWETLLPSLTARLLNPESNVVVLVGVLSTMNELFKRFRDAPQQDALMLQLKTALDGCQAELLQFFKNLTQFALVTPPSDPNTVEQLYSAVRLCCRIFYSLNWQTIPEFFEDNEEAWMKEFMKYLVLQTDPFRAYDDDENPSPLERVQAAILNNVSLYAEKYAKEFQPFLPDFCQASFNLLVKYSSASIVRYDELVGSGMRFLSSAAISVDNVNIFGNPSTIQTLMERIIIPNLEIRQADVESFEDNPIEYLRRDIEGSDAETRRRMACDMIEKLCRNYDDIVTPLCANHIEILLQQSRSGDREAWKKKDAAVTLVLAISVRGSTQKEGATKLKDLNPVLAFLRSNVLTELQPEAASHPVLKADAIKYVAVFRQFIPKEEVLSVVFPRLIHALDHKSIVVHTYAAAAIDGILAIREQPSPGQNFRDSRYKKQDVAQFAQPILVKLFALIDAGGNMYNEYLMKCVVRVINVSRDDVGPVVPQILQKLGETLWRVAQNPSNPTFNHFLFESIAALLKFGFESKKCTVDQLEAVVLPSFGFILEKNILEFVPYVLQVMSQTLLMRQQGQELSGHHQALFPIIMNQATWEHRANIPALTMLLEAFLTRAPQLFADDNRIGQLFNIFDRLLAFRSTEDLSFELMRCVVSFIPLARLGVRLTGVFQSSLMKYTQAKSVNLARSLSVFIGVFIGKHGPDACAQCCEALQPGMFAKVLTQIVVPTLPKIIQQVQKKTVSIGLTRVLCEFTRLDDASWSQICLGLVQFLSGRSGPQDVSVLDMQRAEVNDALEQMAEAGHVSTFARLAFVRDESADDFFPEVSDSQAFFMTKILGMPGMANKALASLQDPHLVTMFKMWANGRV